MLCLCCWWARLMSRDLELPGIPPVPKKRGRPTDRPQDRDSLKAAAAARKRAQRARQSAAGLEPVSVVLPAEVVDALRKHIEFRDLTLADAVEKALRDRFLRKR